MNRSKRPNMVFFRPYLSDAIPATNTPTNTPEKKID